MGFFDSIQKFHGQGETPNTYTTEQYGTPSCSLYTEKDPGDLHQKTEIKDDAGRVHYVTKSSMITLFAKTDILDPDGNPVAHIEKRPISLHEKHFITMADGRKFTLSNELLHIIKDVTNIDGLGWQIQGNIVGLNFVLFDESGRIIAAIGQKAVSVHDRFSIDLYQPRHEAIVVAIVIALSKMLEARRENDK